MSKKPQESDLIALWQQQSVPNIDTDKLHKKFNRMRWRQVSYACGDVFGVLIGLAVLWFSRERMSEIFFTVMLTFVVLSLVFALYIVYLRRFALFAQRRTTREFLLSLTEQTRSNIKIACITKHSTWVSWCSLNIVWLILWAADDMPIEEWRNKFVLMNAVSLLVFIPFWFWAQHRQRKFERALVPLEQSLKEYDSAGN
ncbi:hypothetical protein [Alteromonas oceanisediminis]|uniref:hypothetical protein n=1 Tax=Alteromonas oceanisediminis TaxID=2836180 RepID=UPI001BDB22C3|nr:hypothetical protein [Alteromonas oceanisediminis]MBT0586218.1 hypothetical protein [Alteromonas oceanisediminis]